MKMRLIFEKAYDMFPWPKNFSWRSCKGTKEEISFLKIVLGISYFYFFAVIIVIFQTYIARRQQISQREYCGGKNRSSRVGVMKIPEYRVKICFPVKILQIFIVFVKHEKGLLEFLRSIKMKGRARKTFSLLEQK